MRRERQAVHPTAVALACALAMSGVLAGNGTAHAWEHQHPGSVYSFDEYVESYNAITLGKQPWLDAWYKLRDESSARYNEAVGAEGTAPPEYEVTFIYRDSNNNGTTDDDAALHQEQKALLMDDARAAYLLALRWLFTGETDYRERSIRLIMGWTDTTTSDFGDTNLVMTYGGAGFLLAADVLLAGGEWDGFDAFRSWAETVYLSCAFAEDATGEIPDSNNHQSWAIYGILLFSHVFHDDGLFDQYVDRLLDHIHYTIADDGHMPNESAREDKGIHYTIFALEPMTAAAKIVNNVARTNLFSTTHYYGQKMHKALQYLFYYNEHPEDWPYHAGIAGRPAHALFEAMGDVYNNLDFTEYAAGQRAVLDSDFGWTMPTLGLSPWVPQPGAFRFSMHHFDDGFNLFTGNNGSWSTHSDAGNVVFRQSSVDTSFAHATAGDIEWLDYDLRGKLKVNRWNSNNLSGAGLFARYVDSSNNISFHYYKGSNQLRIERRVNGTFKVLASKTFSFSLGRWYDFRVVTQGPYLRLYVDGTLQLSAKDFSHLGGKVGLYSHRSDTMFDQVRMFF